MLHTYVNRPFFITHSAREPTAYRVSIANIVSDFWGPVSNFGLPIAAILDTQKSPDMCVSLQINTSKIDIVESLAEFFTVSLLSSLVP